MGVSVATNRRGKSFEQAIADVFAGANPHAPSLQLVIERTRNYVSPPTATSGEIVVGVNSLLLGILEVGRFYRETSSAVWLHTWLKEAISEEKIEAVLQNNYGEAERVYSTSVKNGHTPRIVPSLELSSVTEQALAFARDTVKRRNYDLRHLLAAILLAPQSILKERSRNVAGFTAIVAGFPAFREKLFTRICNSPEPKENIDEWARILQIAHEDKDRVSGSARGDVSSALTEGPGRVRPKDGVQEEQANDRIARIPEDLIAGFATDRPGAEGYDSLGVDGDAEAFARLICLEQARPPLSIGLFGGWGAGKSTFMERLEVAITRITAAEVLRRDAIKDGEAKPVTASSQRFLTRVMHIRFNAWQYSDANLWASLTSEFFEQLRAGGHNRQGDVVHERLEQRVKSFVCSLSDDAAVAQQALMDGERELDLAKSEHDLALLMIREAQDKVITNAVLWQITEAYAQNEKGLARLGLILPNANSAKSIEEFKSLAQRLRSLRGTFQTIIDAVWHYKWSEMVIAAVVLLAVIAIYYLLRPESWSHFIGWAATILSVVTVVMKRLVTPIKIVMKIAKDTAGFGERLLFAKNAAVKEARAKEEIVRTKERIVAERQSIAERAKHALQPYASPNGTQEPPRLWRFMLDDDPATKAIEGEVGLISRARRLFQAVDEIARKQRESSVPVADSDVPERIVLYIDDLDRCTHDQVFAVLQAVHLLLAFELFVVIVGVDVAWVEDAISRQMRGDRRDGRTLESEGVQEELTRRKRAIAYLEKIFQIPFWLRPLSTDGDDGGSYGRFVGALVGPGESVGEEEAPVIDVTGRLARTLEMDDRELVVEREPSAEEGGPEHEGKTKKEADTQERALETVRLDKREIDFLANGAIGAVAARNPRGVKRMVNIYRLVRARMSRSELDKLLDKDDPTYPLLAFFVAVETGQPVEISDALYYGLCCEELPTEELNLVHIGERVEKRQGDKRENLFARRQDLEDALVQVRAHRRVRNLPVGECLGIARNVRRYSFSRMQ